MNRCVPSWEVEQNLALPPRALSNYISLPRDVPTIYEVAELTWKDGQLAMHGFGGPKLPTKCSWEKPLAGGTLESIVNQATTIPSSKSSAHTGDELVRWFDDRLPRVPASSIPMTIDALSPCINNQESLPGIGAGLVGCSTTLKDGRAARLSHDWSSRINEQSMSGSGTRGREESRQESHDTCEREIGSPGNTSSAKDCTNTVDDHDSACQSRNQRKEGKKEDKKKLTAKLSASGKRTRCAAVHNQSERKRRDKINERMRTLQKMVPNSCKTDKASMLDEVIEYLKQLQANVHMLNRMNMSTMMLPLALQQQLQMSMMSPMGMAMGMGLGVMDMNTITRPNLSGILPPHHVLHPNPFMPMPSWDIPADRLPPSSSSMPDPLSASFRACQSQPMTMDAYSRMASLYQQFQAPAAPASNSKVI